MRHRPLFAALLTLLAPAATPAYAEEAAAMPPIRTDAPASGFVAANAARLETLLDELDLFRPGLEECRRLHEAGDLAGACEALLSYYDGAPARVRGTPFNAEADFSTLLSASDALQGVFTAQNHRAAALRRADGGIDWAAPSPTGDSEWAWFVNRQQFLRNLADAYLSTHRAVYAEALSGYLADWVLANPAPDRLSFSAPWRALEAARRITGLWTDLFFSRQIPLAPEARLLLLSSIPDHARTLARHGSFWGGNHRLTEQSALAQLAVAWPEFRDAPAWLSGAVEGARAEILSGTYPDGAYKELSNHYQGVVLESVDRLLSVLKDANVSVPDLRERVETMWDYYAFVTRPDGSGPLNNDGDAEWNAFRLPDAAAAHHRPDWLYAASGGAEGTPPGGLPSRYFPYAGQAVMRSGWDRDAEWAFFDMGPAGSAHAHRDRLSLELSLGTHEILVDAGRYNYQPGPWRDYFAGPAAHNVVLLNGEGALPPPATVTAPLPVTAITNDAYDFFSARETFPGDLLTGRGGAAHTRSVLYFPGRFWLVIDAVAAFGPTKVETLWHFHPDVVVLRDGEDLVAWADENLALRLRKVYGPAITWTIERGATDPIQGWYSPDYNEKWPATAAIAQSRGSGPSCTVWLLAPEGPGVTPPEVSCRLVGTTLHATIGKGAEANTFLFDILNAKNPGLAAVVQAL
jgi:hypothetical protein